MDDVSNRGPELILRTVARLLGLVHRLGDRLASYGAHTPKTLRQVRDRVHILQRRNSSFF